MGVIIIALTIVMEMLIAFFLFYFFIFLRDPKINVPEGRNIVSPCYGRLAKIVKFDRSTKSMLVKKGLFGKINAFFSDTVKEGYMLIFTMNIFNVHYQYAPFDGTVENTKYSKGKFLNAVFKAQDFNALENERNEILIANNKLRLKVVQVAGLIARRILCFAGPGQKVKKGQKIGLIKLGSQIVLIVPKVKLKAREGQTVKGAQTIIAEY